MFQVSIKLWFSALSLRCETQSGHPSLKLVSWKWKCHHEQQWAICFDFPGSSQNPLIHVANLIWPPAINTKKVLLKLFQSTTRIHQILRLPSPRNCSYEHYPFCHSQMIVTFIPFFFVIVTEAGLDIPVWLDHRQCRCISTGIVTKTFAM